MTDLNAETVGVSPTGCPISHNAAAFDPFTGPYQVNPADALRWARENEPVFYSPELDYWVVTRFEDVKAVFRDNILFSPANVLEKITPAPLEAQEILKSYGYAMNRTMVNEDEPDHMERRRLLLDAFLPEALKKHEPEIRRLAREYMDRFIDKGKADLVQEVLHEIPLIIALEFLGVRGEDAAELRGFAMAHTVNTWGRPTEDQQLEIAHSVGRFWQTAGRILEKMRANPDGEGWMYDTIRQNELHPEIVTDSYLSSMMMAILAAGHETTSNASANAFRVLLSHRDAWEEICENPALIPNAAEECLRFEGSIVAWRRVTTADTEVGGLEIPKGGKLLIVQTSANHDPRHFENPDEVDLYRDNSSEHLTFGYGAHQCMGKNIGRMEMRIFLEEFTKRLPHMQLVEGQELTYLSNTSFRGPDHLWVEWDPALNPERNDPSILDGHMDFKIGAPVKDEIVRTVEVAEIHDETSRVRRYVLRNPKGRKLPKWTSGSHIDVISGGFRRKYSLCGDHSNSDQLEIAILKEEGGRGGSAYFHETLNIGTQVHIAGPKNHFQMHETANSYVLIAGGIGITPILTMADRLKVLGKKYRIHYCGRALTDMPLLDRVKRDHGKNLFLHPKNEGQRMNLAVELEDLPTGQQIYACGPECLLDALDEMAVQWPDNTLFFERFNAEATLLDPEKEHAFDVVLKDSDTTVRVEANQTVMDALTAAGIDVPCDCSEGLCGTCEVQVLDGDVDHRDHVLSKKERADSNRMMTCCSRAKGDKITIAL
jgi:cytochrome P450/ferredoxin-NADP reductase